MDVTNLKFTNKAKTTVQFVAAKASTASTQSLSEEESK